MTCGELHRHVVAYVEGDLDDQRGAACRGHLRTCAACRALADEHVRLRDALVDLPAVEPAPALWGQIRAQLDADEIAISERSRAARGLDRLVAWLRPTLWPVAMAGSAAALAVVVVRLRAPTPDARVGVDVVPMVAAPTVAAGDGAALPGTDRAGLNRPAGPVQVVRDALDEDADRTTAEQARLREVTAALLGMARPEVATWGTSRAKRFEREVARRERAILAAATDADRSRAWHALTRLLERAALGDQVAALGGGR